MFLDYSGFQNNNCMLILMVILFIAVMIAGMASELTTLELSVKIQQIMSTLHQISTTYSILMTLAAAMVRELY